MIFFKKMLTKKPLCLKLTRLQPHKVTAQKLQLEQRETKVFNMGS